MLFVWIDCTHLFDALYEHRISNDRPTLFRFHSLHFLLSVWFIDVRLFHFCLTTTTTKLSRTERIDGFVFVFMRFANFVHENKQNVKMLNNHVTVSVRAVTNVLRLFSLRAPVQTECIAITILMKPLAVCVYGYSTVRCNTVRFQWLCTKIQPCSSSCREIDDWLGSDAFNSNKILVQTLFGWYIPPSICSTRKPAST